MRARPIVLSVLSAVAVLLAVALPFATRGSGAVSYARPAEVPPDDGASAAGPGEPGPSAATPAKGTIVSLAEPGEVLLAALAGARTDYEAPPAALDAEAEAVLSEWQSTFYHGPDPADYAHLLANERQAIEAGSSPLAMGMAVSGTMKLLVVAVEFAGSDTATIAHPRSMTDRTCVTETLTFTGPIHGRIPPPGPRDNNTLWLPDFGSQHYANLIFGTAGITERVRMDLVDPEDGRAGLDISGQTMQAYFDEASGARVRLEPGAAGIVPWVGVPHSEAYYGASICRGGEAPAVQDMTGLPQNRGGAAQLVRHMADAINAGYPDFPWADYDTDGDGVVDQLLVFHAGKDKANGGGIQSWQALWAHRGGVAQGGRAYRVDDGGTPDDTGDDIAINGYTMQYEDAEPGVVIHEFGHALGLPDLYDTSMGGSNSTENWDVMGAGSRTGKLNSTNPVMLSTWCRFALGWADPVVVTPTEGAAEVRLGQVTRPLDGTADAVRVNLPPTPYRQVAFPGGGRQAWWTGNDQDWADVALARDLSLVGITAPITFAFDLNLSTQRDRDFLFVEVSDDGGSSYVQLTGLQTRIDRLRTTGDDYEDPNCVLGTRPDRPECAGVPNYGGLAHGYTGTSGNWIGNVSGWARVYHDLSPYAGRDVVLRFRYATDARSRSRGAYVDNVAVRAGARTVFEDAVEENEENDWVQSVGTFVPGTAQGEGWRLHDGIFLVGKYYLLEWRNFDGFDRGLRYGYNQIFSTLTPDGRSERRVDTVPMNAPGMVVWLRDLRFGSDPNGTNNGAITDSRLRAFPSEGAKGGIMVIDSHSDPLRGPRGGKVTPIDPASGEKYGPFPFPPHDNWGGRVQTSNAAFGLADTWAITLTAAYKADDPATTVITPTRYARLPAEPAYHDALAYYPGVERLPQPIKVYSDSQSLRLKAFALIDPDASVVVPASAYYAPRTPVGFTGQGAETSPPSADVSTEETIYNFDQEPRWLSIGVAGETEVTGAHSGQPGSTSVQFGYHFQVVGQAPDGAWGTVRLWNSAYEAEALGRVETVPCSEGGWPVHVRVRNVGSPAWLLLYSDFDEARDELAACGGDGPVIPVDVDLATVMGMLTDHGPAMLEALRVAPEAATAVVWWSGSSQVSPADTGWSHAVGYALGRRSDGGIPALPVNTGVALTAFGTPEAIYLPRTARLAP